MIEPTLDKLTRRLDRLERENRRLRVAGVLALLGLISIALMGQLSGAPRIEAQGFYVRDGARNLRAVLGANGLSIMDANGTVRVVVSTSTAMSGVSVVDSAGKPRAVLGMLAGAPALSLRDKDAAVIWKAP